MKKLLPSIDAITAMLTPLLGSAFFIWQNSYFSAHIFMFCWLMFVINMTLTFAVLKDFPNSKSSAFSLIHLAILLSLVSINYLEIEEFILASIIGEAVAMCLAILYYFMFKKGINEESSWKTFGPFTVVLISVFFIGTIYPFIGEWILFIKSSNPGFLMWIAFLSTLLIGVYRKANTLGQIVQKRKKDPDMDMDKQLEKALDNKEPMPAESKFILIGLGLWFFGLGTLYAMFVAN